MFFEETPEERRIFIDQAAARKSVSPSAIEKDFWVCWILQKLFTLESISDHLIFKGGTSLSKVYRLIERFSEDIDISIDREFLGFSGESDPLEAPSNKKRERLLDELQTACAFAVKEQLLPALQEATAKELEEKFSFEIDEEDSQAILFRFPSVIEQSAFSYITPYVKIELGARSGSWPQETRRIRSYIAEEFPDKFGEGEGSPINVLGAERTFWEKATILHAEYNRPESKLLPTRMSRHYYDFDRLIGSDIADKALADNLLREAVVKHKQLFFRSSWAKYDLAAPGTFHLYPAESRLADLESDYNQMKVMFFSDPPELDSILDNLKQFENKLNS